MDPGVRACGCALFRDGRLIAAELVNSRSTFARAAAWLPMAEAVRAWVAIVGVQVARLVIELPQVYHNKIETDQNDLIDLAAVVGAICNAFSDVESCAVVLPAQWKGQTPKEIVHARMAKRLTPEEAAVIPQPVRGKLQKSKLHNILDGIAIGLVDLKRLG